MKLVAGVDIGNATTETAIARIDGKNVTFLSSGITGTTGIKGTKQNIHGVFQSLKNALDEVGFEISDLRWTMAPVMLNILLYRLMSAAAASKETSAGITTITSPPSLTVSNLSMR